MKEPSTWAALIALTASAFVLAAQVQTKVSARIEVRIPERAAALYLERPGLMASAARGPRLASRPLPRVPSYCDRPASAFLCPRPQDTRIFFDLRCAIAGTLPEHCAALYPETGGRLFDDRGRPYPPMLTDALGRVVPGSKRFPQFFTHPSLRLHVFSQAARWQLSARLEAPLLDAVSGRTLGPEHLAVRAVITGDGQRYPATPAWKCLGYAADWGPDTICPAPAGADGGVLLEDVENYPGGWLSLTLGVRLRLDGSETPGQYEGTLTYVYTEL